MIKWEYAYWDSMGIYVKRRNLKGIDRQNNVVKFDENAKHGKITGSRFLSVLGKDEYTTEFKAACMLARVCFDDTKTKFTMAGDAIEPIMRNHVRDRKDTLLKSILQTDGQITVEEPISKEVCFYDHFPGDKLFGGMVDGYIDVDRERYAILEIKTCSDRSAWFDEDGKTKIPEGYYLQASLYAVLSDLKKIVFAVAFLEEHDYVEPEKFVPTDDNTLVFMVDRKDMSEEMAYAKEWYSKYIDAGMTPEWTERDLPLVEMIATSDTIDDMPNEARRLFKKYVRMVGSDEDASDLEYNLKEIMSERVADGIRTLVYKVDGATFSYSADTDRLTFTPDSIQN